MLDFHIVIAEWTRLAEDARSVRTAVFVNEQNIPADLEWDDMDGACQHAVAYDAQGVPLGTGRLLPDGHIGRMAVMPLARRSGVGAALLGALLDLAQAQGHVQARLHAQRSAVPFYLDAGFVTEGVPYLEAGIEHITMTRTLHDRNNAG